MKIDLLQGTLDMLILKALTWGSMHGYAITRWLEQTTDEALQVEEGSLYPALHRMQRKGWVSAEWGVSENNRKAKYYRLTPAGRAKFREKTRSWARLVGVVEKALASQAEVEGV